MKSISYIEILKENNRFAKMLPSKKYTVQVLSNISNAQLNEILEYTLRYEDVPAIVMSGDYDNIIQNSIKYNKSNLVIIFWELCNLLEGMQYKVDLFNDTDFTSILEKVVSEVDLIFNSLAETSCVLFNRFTGLHFANKAINKTRLEDLARQLNCYIDEHKPENVRTVDIDKILFSVGLEKSINLRYFYSARALYTVDYYKAYADYVKPIIMSTTGKAKKALIFDCDNTLWNGILGEDGFDKIEMSTDTTYGAIFSEIQSLALSLFKQGVLLGLCTKNNPDDVEQVLFDHPDMIIRDQHLAIKKVNWNNKVSNLNEISQELNIGLDSIVLVDDSLFEVNLIRNQLPEVKVLQVPEKLYEYPKMIRENMGLFYNRSATAEDKIRVSMYKQQAMRGSYKKQFENLEDYLISLEMEMIVFNDDKKLIPRIAQMSQKTNQFNLTTKRYTEGDINRLVGDHNALVMAISITDKYGDSGVTGLCIVKIDRQKGVSEIDTFLLSCRIIGRNIEFVFIDTVVNRLKSEGVITIVAKYIKTNKNQQVMDFYDDCSFKFISFDDSKRYYKLHISDYKPHDINYIKVSYGKTD